MTPVGGQMVRKKPDRDEGAWGYTITVLRTLNFISGLCVLLACALLASAQQTRPRDLRLSKATRRALVIGNNDYAKAPPLFNAVNDANDLAGVLRGLDFDVEVLTNADHEGMERSVRTFAASLGAGDVAFFHFSGHGLQIDGENYLIPVDFEISDEIGAKHDAYSASEVHERIAASKAALNILTLDACRNNGFSRTRGWGGGLAPMNAARGSFMAFATGPGKTADDNPKGRNGRFTEAMLTALKEPGVELGQVFRRVTERVIDGTAGKQVPWTSSSVVGEFYFLIDNFTVNMAPPQPTGGDVAPQFEIAYWNSIKDSSESAAFESYLERYPNGTFVTLAKLKLENLRTPAPTVSPPAPTASVARVEPTRPARQQQGETQPRDIRVNAKDGLEYVWIPPGTFMMGCVPGDTDCFPDEKPRHRVTITDGFWMGRTEATVAAYERFALATQRGMPAPPSFDGAWKKKNHPIVRVSWSDAGAYCSWAGGRLPTEAEWEYAARGGKEGLRFPWGNEISRERANYGADKCCSGLAEGRDEWGFTSPVGSFSPTGYGLYDLNGNVWEWVGDWYDGDYYRGASSANPQGPASGERRVLRGGSWFDVPQGLRASYRSRNPPVGWDGDVGFRCTREVSP